MPRPPRSARRADPAPPATAAPGQPPASERPAPGSGEPPAPSGSDALRAKIERDAARAAPPADGPAAGVHAAAVAALPTRFGIFQVVAFHNDLDGKEHLALVRGDVVDQPDVLTRMHSECLTGDTLGSLRCDCRDQLEAALNTLGQAERGVLLYLRQEGRGIGLANKIRAYELQDDGLDTVEANLALGFRDDERDYAIAAHMLRTLGVASVRLMTNNPRKIEQLRHYGVNVSGRVPHVLPPNDHNRFYLETKANRSGHYIDFTGKPHLPEQQERVRVLGMADDDDGEPG